MAIASLEHATIMKKWTSCHVTFNGPFLLEPVVNRHECKKTSVDSLKFPRRLIQLSEQDVGRVYRVVCIWYEWVSHKYKQVLLLSTYSIQRHRKMVTLENIKFCSVNSSTLYDQDVDFLFRNVSDFRPRIQDWNSLAKQVIFYLAINPHQAWKEFARPDFRCMCFFWRPDSWAGCRGNQLNKRSNSWICFSPH